MTVSWQVDEQPSPSRVLPVVALLSDIDDTVAADRGRNRPGVESVGSVEVGIGVEVGVAGGSQTLISQKALQPSPSR